MEATRRKSWHLKKKQNNIQSRSPELQVGGVRLRIHREEFVLHMQRETSPSKSGEKEERTEVDEDSSVALHGRAPRVFTSRDLRGKVLC